MHFDNYCIRLLEQGDVTAYFRLIEANRPRLEDFFAGLVSKTKTAADTSLFIAGAVDKINEKTYFPFLIIDSTDGRTAGFIDVKNIDWSIPKAELGCFMDKEHEGKGIATKAMNIIVAHLFGDLGFNKLFLRTHESNNAARALAAQCGFEQEGILRRDYKTTQGQLVDLVYYGLLKK